jgi:serine/threonine protein kinase
MVGTLQYIAPEVFDLEQDFDFSYDVWSFGCLLYELVVGSPPFGNMAESREDIQYELLSKEVDMKDYFSKDFKALLSKLLEKSTKERITFDEVMKEPFFKKV